jgi:prepilin-type N-terminal cleavage/methylation domain-containing protein
MKKLRITFQGFSLLELMLAIAIVTLCISAVALLQVAIPGSLLLGAQSLTATQLSAALLQKEFLLGSQSFDAVGSLSTTTLSVASLSGSSFSGTSTTYAFSLTAQPFPDGVTKFLTSTAAWIDVKGITHTVSLHSVVSNALNAPVNSCGNFTSDWSHPSVRTIPLASLGITANAPIQSLAISGNLLIAGVLNAISKTDPTLFLFSISSSTNPVLLGSIDTATSTKSGPSALATDGTYVYSANSYGANFSTCSASPTCSQMQVFDARIPSQMHLITNFQLATATAPFAAGNGGQSAGKSIVYDSGLIYLGLQKSVANGEEFNIVNVQNPAQPVWLGGYSIGRTVNHIEVSNGFAYLATDNPSAEVTILDVHDPTHITLAGSYDAPGPTDYGYGEALAQSPTTLILGRSYTPNNAQVDILSPYLLSSSTELSLIASSSLSSSTASTESMVLQGSVLAILENAVLEVWNLITPAQPYTVVPSIALPGSGSTVTNASLICKDGTVYIASSDASKQGYLTMLSGN